MSIAKKYVGLDVSKQSIAVAIADEGRENARFFGTIVHTKEAVCKLIQKLKTSEDVILEVCYEAGPTGYALYRWLLELNIDCTVIAPSLIPKRAGDRVKTDKRDARRLAELFRAGELTSIYVPTPQEEALRDLVRAREGAKESLNRDKQRLGKFLLRHQLAAPNGAKPWTHAFNEWLDTVTFKEEAQQFALNEYRQAIRENEQRVKRYEKEIERLAEVSVQAPLIEALQALRGVAVLTATTLVSEIGSMSRFAHPSAFMSYCGLTPSESSSGLSRWQGGITKAGNAHLRRVLVEAAKGYRYNPAVKRKLRERLDGLPAEIQSIAWDAQHRLHKKYKEMKRTRKHNGKIAVAIARELAGFVWAIATTFDSLQKKKAA